MKSAYPLKRYLGLYLSGFFFGATSSLGQLILVSANHIAFYRSLFAAVAVFGFIGLRGGSFRLSWQNVAWNLAAGVFIGAHWITFFLTVKFAGVAVAALTFSTFPLFLTYLEPLVLKQRPNPVKVLLSLGLMLGIFLITPEFDPNNIAFIGVLIGLLSALLFAVLSLLYRFMKTDKLTGFFWQMVISAGFCAFFVTGPWLPGAALDWFWLALLGLVCTVGAHGLLIWSLREVSAQSAGMVLNLEGVYGVILGVLLFDEVVTPTMLLGGAILLGITVCICLYDYRTEPG